MKDARACEASAFADTLAPDSHVTRRCAASEARRDSDAPAAHRSAFASLPDERRYEKRDLLGRGGMGEVILCWDHKLGREVAMKQLHPGLCETAALLRFEREARLQARLEHPAFIPTYDAGVIDGRLYFTMKRVRGRTLEAVLSEPYSLRRLLSAFVSLCLAVDYAHEHGVLHRDIKPANVMLGDFGELLILDWGIAAEWTTAGRPQEVAGRAPAPPESSPERPTLAGSIVGTAGYLSPEQARGQHCLSPASDVYSLGAILYEIVLGRRVHPQETPAERLLSTLVGASFAQCDAANDSLIELCRWSLELEPEKRCPSARALAEGVERYLDVEQESDLRRRDAHRLVERVSLGPANLGEGRDAARREALGELAMALMLDPANQAARLALKKLIAEPADAPAAHLRTARTSARRGLLLRTLMARHGIWLLATVTLACIGLRSANLFAVILIGFLLSLGFTVYCHVARVTSDRAIDVLAATTTLSLGLVSLATGPLLVVPGLIATNSVFFALETGSKRQWRHLAMTLAALILPWTASLCGLAPRFTDVTAGGDLLFHSPGIVFTPFLHEAVLLLCSVLTAVSPAILAARLRDRDAAVAERDLRLGLQLRELVPASVRDSLGE